LHYQDGWRLGTSWPVLLIAAGALLAARALAPPPQRPRQARPRPSLWGPLLTLAAGIGLLANNLSQGFALGGFLRDGWPWLLIAWSAFRVAEFLLLRILGRSTPAPAGAGALLVIVLTCFGGALSSILVTGGLESRFWLWTLRLS
jgi:hypothetical protein